MTKTVSNFADLEEFYAEQVAKHSENLDRALTESAGTSQLSVFDEPTTADMPDNFVMQRSIEMAIQTIFDAFRDTRMEEYSKDIAWGIVNSMHMTGRRNARREDDAAKKVGELVRCYDPSEIYAHELEEAQAVCESLMQAQEALDAMRDYAAAVYAVETGEAWTPARGSKIAVATGASHIAAQDLLAARSKAHREALTPTGPRVLFSGGAAWKDGELVWKVLDDTLARIPNMVLITTAMTKGADKFAHSWAEQRGVTTVRFPLTGDRNDNSRAWNRNKRMMKENPVHAIICEGTGIQSKIYEQVRNLGIPHNALPFKMQNIRKVA